MRWLVQLDLGTLGPFSLSKSAILATSRYHLDLFYLNQAFGPLAFLNSKLWTRKIVGSYQTLCLEPAEERVLKSEPWFGSLSTSQTSTSNRSVLFKPSFWATGFPKRQALDSKVCWLLPDSVPRASWRESLKSEPWFGSLSTSVTSPSNWSVLPKSSFWAPGFPKRQVLDSKDC